MIYLVINQLNLYEQRQIWIVKDNVAGTVGDGSIKPYLFEVYVAQY